MPIEYRVKPVTRYIITHHESGELSPAQKESLRVEPWRRSQNETRQIGGEHASAEVAYEVAYALARWEAENLGLPPGDTRLIYPAQPDTISHDEPELFTAHEEHRV